MNRSTRPRLRLGALLLAFAVAAAIGTSQAAPASAASPGAVAKQALALAKKADRKASQALRQAAENGPGTEGPAGADGEPGPKGPAGAQGIAGLIGATGLTGATGLPGATGAAGATGQTGANGLPGPAGAAGSAGARGPTGDAGPAGEQGVAGTNGNNGLNGRGFNYRGAFVLNGTYDRDDVVTYGGGAYITRFTIDQAVNPPPRNSLWDVLVSQGEPGIPGGQGVAGPQGPQGPAGPSGILVNRQVITYPQADAVVFAIPGVLDVVGKCGFIQQGGGTIARIRFRNRSGQNMFVLSDQGFPEGIDGNEVPDQGLSPEIGRASQSGADGKGDFITYHVGRNLGAATGLGNVDVSMWVDGSNCTFQSMYLGKYS